MRRFGVATGFLLGAIEIAALIDVAVAQRDETHQLSAPLAPETRGMAQLRGLLTEDVRSQIARRVGLPASEFRVEIENLRLYPQINLTDLQSVKALGVEGELAKRLEGLFSLPVIVRFGAPAPMPERELQISGVIKVTGPIYVSRANLPRGTILTEEDLVLTTLPWRNLANGAAGLSKADLVGRRVRSLVSTGQAFTRAHLDEPLAVKSGDPVELTLLSGPGVIIRSKAISRQEGHVGDIIRVEQPETKKMLTGQVTGRRSVEIRL